MRAFLSGLCNFATNLYIFLVIKTFPDCKCALYCTVLYPRAVQNCTVLYCTVLYCTVLYPRPVQAAISPAGSYYFYASVAVAAALLGLTVLPETKVRHSKLYNDI